MHECVRHMVCDSRGMPKKRSSISTFVLASTLVAAPLQAAPALDSNRAQAAHEERSAPSNSPKGAVLGSRADEQRYAAREAASPDAKQYRGGDVIVISATAVAIALLIVLVILLL